MNTLISGQEVFHACSQVGWVGGIQLKLLSGAHLYHVTITNVWHIQHGRDQPVAHNKKAMQSVKLLQEPLLKLETTGNNFYVLCTVSWLLYSFCVEALHTSRQH